MVHTILLRNSPNQQARLHLALSPENWVRDGARATDKHDNIVGPVSPLACRFSILGLLQHHFGYGPVNKGYYYQALLANKLPPSDRIDQSIDLQQANQILATYLSLRFGNLS